MVVCELDWSWRTVVGQCWCCGTRPARRTTTDCGRSATGARTSSSSASPSTASPASTTCRWSGCPRSAITAATHRSSSSPPRSTCGGTAARRSWWRPTTATSWRASCASMRTSSARRRPATASLTCSRLPRGRRWESDDSSVAQDVREKYAICSDYLAYRERKCADTIGTVLVPWAGHFQC